MQKDKHPVASCLFGVAAIQAVVGFLAWSYLSPQFALIDWVITFSFAIFAGLAILARWSRLPAAVIATTIYVAFLLLQMSISMELLLTGLIFKVPAVLLLVLAIGLSLKSLPRRSGHRPDVS